MALSGPSGMSAIRSLSEAKRTSASNCRTTAIYDYTPLRSVPAEFIGYVEAPDEQQAIKQAIKQFQISDPKKQEWLVAQRMKLVT
jgi:hypothetical protein